MKRNIQAYKYLAALISPIVIMMSFLLGGWWSYTGVVYAFLLIPLIELFLHPSPENLNAIEETLAKKDRFYDWLIYSIVPLQYGLLLLFLVKVHQNHLLWWEIIGYISSMGVACGVFGINVAHELGHRKTSYERLMAKLLLLTSLYMHFIIEHNRGHHKHVSTDLDPASAKQGESVYVFWIRSIFNSYVHAWKLESDRLKKKGKFVFSFQNEMIVFQCVQIVFLLLIFWLFNWQVMLYFIIAALMGIALLETVNYIEHYGLRRKKIGEGRWEKTLPIHSWNSDHPLGRILLFELTRHSDHHYIASRPYQILRHFDESPQMPAGYPGMMVLALFPPIWYRVMHKEIDALKAKNHPLA